MNDKLIHSKGVKLKQTACFSSRKPLKKREFREFFTTNEHSFFCFSRFLGYFLPLFLRSATHRPEAIRLIFSEILIYTFRLSPFFLPVISFQKPSQVTNCNFPSFNFRSNSPALQKLIASHDFRSPPRSVAPSTYDKTNLRFDNPPQTPTRPPTSHRATPRPYLLMQKKRRDPERSRPHIIN